MILYKKEPWKISEKELAVLYYFIIQETAPTSPKPIASILTPFRLPSYTRNI